MIISRRAVYIGFGLKSVGNCRLTNVVDILEDVLFIYLLLYKYSICYKIIADIEFCRSFLIFLERVFR